MDDAEWRLLSAVARRFYLEDASKTDLATEFSISRFRVARPWWLERLFSAEVWVAVVWLPELSCSEQPGVSCLAVISATVVALASAAQLGVAADWFWPVLA